MQRLYITFIWSTAHYLIVLFSTSGASPAGGDGDPPSHGASILQNYSLLREREKPLKFLKMLSEVSLFDHLSQILVCAEVSGF